MGLMNNCAEAKAGVREGQGQVEGIGLGDREKGTTEEKRKRGNRASQGGLG